MMFPPVCGIGGNIRYTVDKEQPNASHSWWAKRSTIRSPSKDKLRIDVPKKKTIVSYAAD